MRVFIAGVMQGSRFDDRVSDQEYRQIITCVLQQHVQDLEIIDPWALHPDSESYDTVQARDTFLRMNALAGQVDILVAYAPEATMGTAIEIWEAYRNGAQVFTISPMRDNWVVKLLSSQVFPSLDAFVAFVADGGLTVN
mgnify:CR=1 FL=1